MGTESIRIAVYLGSGFGKDPMYADAVSALGHHIGQQGMELVYGGSRNGLMGVLASAVKESGGQVTGVEPEFFVNQDFDMPGLDHMIVVKDMSERKARMIGLADAFIAFPGGIGTLDEISEVIVLNALGQIRKPYVLYDLHGYYRSLREQLLHMLQEGFLTPEKCAGIRFVSDEAELFEFLDGLTGCAGDRADSDNARRQGGF
jgi:hypothetical protein